MRKRVRSRSDICGKGGGIVHNNSTCSQYIQCLLPTETCTVMVCGDRLVQHSTDMGWANDEIIKCRRSHIIQERYRTHIARRALLFIQTGTHVGATQNGRIVLLSRPRRDGQPHVAIAEEPVDNLESIVPYRYHFMVHGTLHEKVGLAFR
jgi:hypothetical protein